MEVRENNYEAGEKEKASIEERRVPEVSSRVVVVNFEVSTLAIAGGSRERT